MRRFVHLALLVATHVGCGGATPPAQGAHRAAEAAAHPEPSQESRAVAERRSVTRGSGADVLADVLLERLTVRHRPDGSRILTRWCREGPVPCEDRIRAFAALMISVAERHDLDPWLIAALAIRESGLDPSVLGRRREAGIVQLHPRGAGRGVRYVEEAGYRAACQRQVDACQDEVLEIGARTLAQSIERCGGLIRGLGAYAAGHCTDRPEHPRRVLEERDRLRAAARAAE